MKQYNIFCMGTINLFNFIKTLAINLKKYKKEDSKYIFHAFLFTDDLETYYKELNYLISNDFEIDLQSYTKYEHIIIPASTGIHWSTYLKCLACSLFPNLDKILYLDVDLFVVNKGLEEFMDADITDYYTNACIDVVPTYNNKKEIQNCKVNNYINTGVLLLNLKKMRQDGVDKKMEDAVTGKWPYDEVKPNYCEQSLMNYLFHDKVLISDPKFNNNLLPTLYSDLEAFKDFYKKWGYNDLIIAMSQAVILHYAGVKPWKQDEFQKYIRYMVFPQLSFFVYNYFNVK